MKGSREVVEMEDTGEIKLIETTPNCDMGWVYTRVHDNNLVSITGHEYVPVEPVDQEEIDAHEEAEKQIAEEMKNDAIFEEEKERRAGLFDVHPELLGLIKDYKKQLNKIEAIDQKIKELKNDTFKK